MAKQVNFTVSIIEKLVWSDTKTTYYSDKKLKHHRIVITNKGHISYQVYMRFNGKPVKRTIGNYPNITPDIARKLAKTVIAELSLGVDRYLDKKQTPSTEQTYADIWRVYRLYLVDKSYRKPKTAKRNISQCDSLYKSCKQFHNMPLNEITTELIVDFHRHYSFELGRKYNANNAVRQIRACFNYANIEPNPVNRKKVKMNKEKKKKVFLTKDQLTRFLQAMELDSSRQFRDVFKLCLFTAARVGSVCGMEWSEIDLVNGLWTTVTKNSENEEDLTQIGLTKNAIDVLKARKELTNGSQFVFPGKTKSGHISQPQYSFKRIAAAAGIEGVSPHALRRTAATYFARNGGSNQGILTLLGNKSESTIKIYVTNDVELVTKQNATIQDNWLGS